MKKEALKALLNKYYEGNTHSEEEEALKNYFRNEEVPEELEPDKALFSSLDKPINSSAEDRSEEIMNFIREHSSSGSINKGLIGKKLWIPVAAAASIALVFSLWISLMNLNEKKFKKDTYSDPEMAYLETKKALLMVSEKMNKGMEPLEDLSALSTIEKGLDNFSQFGKTARKLKNIDRIEESEKK